MSPRASAEGVRGERSFCGLTFGTPVRATPHGSPCGWIVSSPNPALTCWSRDQADRVAIPLRRNSWAISRQRALGGRAPACLRGTRNGARERGGVDRKFEHERRSVPFDRFNPDIPSHAAHELAADVEPEPGPADATCHLRIEAIELLEDACLLLGWDSDALVLDVEEHGLLPGRLSRFESDLDPAAVG